MYFLLIKSLESDIVKSVLAASLLCSFLALIFRKRQSFQANKYSVEIFLDLPHFHIKGLTDRQLSVAELFFGCHQSQFF